MRVDTDIEDWVKPCEEEMEELEREKLKSKMVNMSPTGAMWLRGALGHRLEAEPMPMSRNALADD